MNIEFAPEEFLSNSSMTCPTCGKKTWLHVTDQAKPDKPDAEILRLNQQGILCFNQSGDLSEEAIRLANAARAAFKAAKSKDGSKLLEDSRRVQADAKKLMEEGNQLIQQARELGAPGDISAPTASYVTCRCQHCDTGIEFDAAELTEENSMIPCPHCGLETKLFIPESVGNAIDLGELPPSVLELVRNGQKIAAIKELKSIHPSLGLSGAKQIVETIEANSVTAAAEMLRQHKTDLAEEVKPNKAEKEAQLKMLEEMANSRTIFYNLDTLKLAGDTISICKRGWANALASGMNGERTIQIPSLTSVQMKPAALLTPGYILFSYAGSKPFMGGVIDATQDPDAFLFGTDQNRDVAEFKTLVEKKMREARQPAPANNSKGNSLADELRSLAELKQQGILSQEEFDAAKKKLLA
jgi:DNA-directed RNA polymerase subunit RPC12/RpoP